jgi:5-hydroxyisourate hydrolase-like protein (transthyretin family)
MPVKYLRYILLLTALPFCGYAQRAAPANIKQMVAAIDSFTVAMPAEKLYLHTDKPYYNHTDTIWIKAYLLDDALSASKQSGLLYTELVNDTGKVVLRQAMPVMLGLSWGQIPLDEKVPEGAYTLRAYTNWMQNLGEQCFFTRAIYINKPDEGGWLVKTASTLKTVADKYHIETAIQLTDQSGSPIRLQTMQVKLTDDKKIWLREKMQTDVDGRLNFNTAISEKADAGRLTILAQNDAISANSKQLVIPLNITRDAETDVQFFPEGGYMVAGLTSRIGFKATAENGKGMIVSGTIKDSKGQNITTFKSNDKGIGSFNLTLLAGETYTSDIKLSTLTKTYALPADKSSGIVLRINNIPGRDSLLFTIQATPDIASANSTFTLTGQSGGTVCYASALQFTNNIPIINGKIAKSSFATGTTRFTLFNNNNQPLAERMVFINHHDQLNIEIKTEKSFYRPTDSVTLQVQVTDKDNKPVTGNFSLAVTDDSQLKADSVNDLNIVSRMLLTANLKGDIESPGYYFNKPDSNTETDLDNLLLTQGWVGYDWKTVFNPTLPKFKAEKEMEITGTITRISGKPLAGLPVSLLSTKKPTLFMDTVTNSDGRFKFTHFPRIDTAAFMIQLKDKKARMFEARINVDEFTPAGTNYLAKPRIMPWYVNTDTTMLNYNKQYLARQKQMDIIKYPDGSRTLAEVVIKGKRKIKGSKFFDGAGVQPDQVFDEADMNNAKKLTLEDFLRKNIKGFGVRTYPCDGPPVITDYTVYCGLVFISIDGEPINQLYTPPPSPSMSDHYGFQQAYLQTITAEDVRGIEVRTNNSPERSYTIIELTTWSGNGIYMKRVKGRYLYRPTPISWPKQFYNPKYVIKNNVPPVNQPTIYWAPSITTDSTGGASVTFNTGTKPGTYTLILQGSNISGNVGYQTKKITVK